MTYSMIYNIKATKIENYTFKFKKEIKVRFLTFDNQKGIDLGIKKEQYVNYTDVSDNLWYLSSNINDYSILNSYNYLIVQIYCDDEISNNVLEKDTSFYVTNKNKLYNCYNLGPTCGIKIYNFQINSNKPLQQINKVLKYTILGDAKVIDFKYIKSGPEYDSKIKITTYYPNEVNFINNFLLKKLITNKQIKKENIYSEITIPNIEISDNKEINSLNYIVEHLKFQLKNYFVENNKNLSDIDSKFFDIYQNIDKISDNNLSIKNLEHHIKNMNKKIELNQQSTEKISYLTNKIQKFENAINLKIDENNNIFNNHIKNLYSKINNLDNKIDINEISDIKKNIDILKEKTNKLEIDSNIPDESALLIDSLSSKITYYIQLHDNMYKKINEIKKFSINSNNENSIKIQDLSNKIDNYINNK